MDMRTWMPIYYRIAADIGISIDKDRQASRILSDLIRANPDLMDYDQVLDELKNRIDGRPCIVFGTSESLEQSLDSIPYRRIKNIEDDQGTMVIAADGATSVLMSRGISPDLIVTDLDGGIEDQIECSRRETFLIIHGHGDNIERLKSSVPRFEGRVLGSTQQDHASHPPLVNFGGFTDGDRACHIASSLNASSIKLIGFDRGPVGRKVVDGGRRVEIMDKDLALKTRKLRWAWTLISMIEFPEVNVFPEDPTENVDGGPPTGNI